MTFANKVSFINEVLDCFGNNYKKAKGYINRCYIRAEIDGKEERELLDMLDQYKANGWI